MGPELARVWPALNLLEPHVLGLTPHHCADSPHTDWNGGRQAVYHRARVSWAGLGRCAHRSRAGVPCAPQPSGHTRQARSQGKIKTSLSAHRAIHESAATPPRVCETSRAAADHRPRRPNRSQGWWTYELCISGTIRQFHQDRTHPIVTPGAQDSTTNPAALQSATKLPKALGTAAITQEYILGVYYREPVQEATAGGTGVDGGAGVRPRVSSGSKFGTPSAANMAALRGEIAEEVPSKQRYFGMRYGNGTQCDKTGRPRETEVRLFCSRPDEPSHLASIEEVSTCKYVVHFRSPLHCRHPSFDGQKRRSDTVPIKCEPLDAAGRPLPAIPKWPPSAAPLLERPFERVGQRGLVTWLGDGRPAAVARGSPVPEVAGASAQPAVFQVGQCFVHRRYNYRGVIVQARAHAARRSALPLRAPERHASSDPTLHLPRGCFAFSPPARAITAPSTCPIPTLPPLDSQLPVAFQGAPRPAAPTGLPAPQVDRRCEQSEAWVASMHIDKLKHGREQPFYHVLPDTRDRPGASTAYVAHELLLLDTPPEPLQHPLTSSLFDRFDAASGRYLTKPGVDATSRDARAKQDPLAAEARTDVEL
eukprot:scaffold13249_cov118-Isochrysis_galbana.AAC.12